MFARRFFSILLVLVLFIVLVNKQLSWQPSSLREVIVHYILIFLQLMETTRSGASGRVARIHVDPDSCFVVEHVPIPLLLAVDLTAQDWGDPFKARSVSLWIVQVQRGVMQLLISAVTSCSLANFAINNYIYLWLCSLFVSSLSGQPYQHDPAFPS